MKSTVIELLTTTTLNYNKIAKEVGCSLVYVKQIDLMLRKNKQIKK